MALPICIARCIEHVCIVLSNLVPNKDLKVLGLNDGPALVGKLSQSPDTAENSLQPARPGNLARAHGKLCSPSSGFPYSSTWTESTASASPYLKSKACGTFCLGNSVCSPAIRGFFNKQL